MENPQRSRESKYKIIRQTKVYAGRQGTKDNKIHVPPMTNLKNEINQEKHE